MPTAKSAAIPDGEILLVAAGARYHHASLGLRCLAANMGDLAGRTRILELDIADRPADAVERILSAGPAIVGMGVHVWSAQVSHAIAARLKALRPEISLVVGGPEVSFPEDWPPVARLADHVVTGEGELAFADLCRALLRGEPAPRVIAGGEADLAVTELPYHLYTDEDIAHRVLYVEATRGCAGGCEFCLSSLSAKVRSYPVRKVLQALDDLWARGARAFKFTDRALNYGETARILEALAERAGEGLFAHFELVPRGVPERIFELLRRFPPGSLQLEVGVQTLSPEVAARIGRRQDPAEALEVIRHLVGTTSVHVHTDLVAGLPGETAGVVAAGFDALLAAGPHEIQVGILKRLRGAPISRHDAAWRMIYSPDPPYEVLQTGAIPFMELQRLKRFSRYFDLVHNSGGFPLSGAMLLDAPSPFEAFMGFSDWLHSIAGRTHGIARDRLGRLIARHLEERRGVTPAEARAAVEADLARRVTAGTAAPTGQRRQRRRLETQARRV